MIARHSRFGKATSCSLIALLAASTLTGCVANNGQRPATGNGQASAESACSRVNEAVGTAIGVGLGVLAGKLIFGKAGGMIGGGILGGVIGNLIGRDFDERACEMEKIAAKAGTSIEQERIMWREPPPAASGGASASASAQKAEEVPIGQITRWQQEGAFASGSAELTPKAREYFAQAARLYLPKPPDAKQVAQLQGAEREQYLAGVKAKNEVPILLVGNTDDVGDSQANQRLSEARAKAVGEVFRAAGIDAKRIYYWGAGETRPVADNGLEEGRSRNRRVDVMEFQSDKALAAFIQADKPKTNFYRAPERRSAVAVAAPAETTAGKRKVATKAGEPAAPTPTPSPAARPAQASAGKHDKPLVDFGGTKVNAALPSLFDQAGGAKPPSVSLGIISTAFAAAPPTATCAEDRARHGGKVKSLATGQPISSYNTADFLPGLNNVPWGGQVNDNLVVLSGVTVLRSDSKPVTDPTLEIYPGWGAVTNKAAAKPAYSLATAVSTYEAKDGFVYRVFAEDARSPVACMDILVPYTGFKSATGRLHYTSGPADYVATYQPALLR